MWELAEKTKMPIAGKDFKTGQTLVKSGFAPMIGSRCLGLSGWFSTNILGNRDGLVLDEPANFHTKEVSKLSTLESILEADKQPDLYSNYYHKVRINYYPPRNDNKEGWDNIDIFGWMGYPMQIKINFLCRDSILAAPLLLDLVLLSDLAARKGRYGTQRFLSFFLKSPMHDYTQGEVLKGLYIGSGTDIPLCDEGRAQLQELKERFEYPQVDTVFSSPLMRSVETANILFPNATHQFSVHDLREAGFGVFENRPVKELVKDEDFKKWITPGSGFVPEGAEPTEQFHARCAETLLKLFEYMIRMDVTEAACVTHGGVIMSMLSQRALPSRHPEQWMADPGCGYTVQTDVQLWMRDRLVEAIDIVPFGYADTLRGQAETEENEAFE